MSFPPLPSPCVSLVGAGPGDPELLTLKGLRAIESANVILYDALCDERILDYAPKETRRIYVGKRCGKDSLTQETINELIVKNALAYGHVVRLKGGDPFVFGRGGEEWLALRAAGIPVRIIPGVSSAIAAPALAGIPLTHRGTSRGFWVITATTKDHTLPKEMRLAARSCATVVILMGTKKIASIAGLFAKYRSANTPIALVQSGSTAHQKVTTTTLSCVEALQSISKNGEAGILVIGEVVTVLNDFKQADVLLKTVSPKKLSL